MKQTRGTAGRLSIKMLFLLQAVVCLYSISGIFAKTASGYAFLSMGYILCYGAELFILGLYAIIWQQIIKRIDLSLAYANRASAIFWSALWATIFFHEQLSIKNIAGIFVIFIGIWVVNQND